MIEHEAMPGRAGARGLTLVELLVAMFLIAIGVLAAAPMFMAAIEESAVGADLGSAGAVANERLELLRAERWRDLVPGGSLTADLPGYFDDSHSGFIVRWRIEDKPNPLNSKGISVRAVAERRVVGRAKDVVLTTLRSR